MAKNKLLEKPKIPPGHVRTRDIDLSVLTATEIAALKQTAEVRLTAKLKVDAEEEFIKQEMDRLEKTRYPSLVEEMREVRINLALYADRILLDGRSYFHGEVYNVPKSVYDVIKECEAASFRHDDEVHGDPDANFYKRNRARYKLSARTGAATDTVGAPARF
jgi:hypothetical protein